jgi:hypothetical protein
MGVKGVDAECTVGAPTPTPMQQKIDAFKDSATLSLSTPEGHADVAIPFRMAFLPGDYEAQAAKDPQSPFVIQEAKARANIGVLKQTVIRLGLGGSMSEIASGRGTPAQIRLVTQALIVDKRLPPGSSTDLPGRIRTMMCDYGLGLDCAGYVQQAFLASRGISRNQTGLSPAIDENLKGLGGKGFKSVPVSQVRDGDLFILGGQPGHTLVVRSARPATQAQADTLAAQAPGGWGHPSTASLRMIEVDSSFGNGGNPRQGGVLRETWCHDEVGKRWLRQVGPETWQLNPDDMPYQREPIEGIYRPRQEP